METINIQFQVPSTGQYTLDEFVAKLKDYAEKLASSISKSLIHLLFRKIFLTLLHFNNF